MLARIGAVIVAAAGVALAPAVLAGPVLLFDAADGRVLYAEDQDNLWHPASLTKMMTAYVTFRAIREGTLTLQTKIYCSGHANGQGPIKAGIRVGATLTVENALQAVIVKSANDVAVMLAEAVAGSHEAFVDYMNAMAARLGMTRTRFANANGLPADEQVTTARDLAKLAMAVVHEYPEYAHIWSMLSVQIGNRRLGTHNGLLTNYAGADGLKTGFTCGSGFNVVASATRQGRKLIAVVLGEATGAERSVRAASLLEHGFQTHKWKALFAAPTVETMPMAEDAKATVTIPGRVISYVCGTGRRRAVAKVRRNKSQVLSRRMVRVKKKSRR